MISRSIKKINECVGEAYAILDNKARDGPEALRVLCVSVEMAPRFVLIPLTELRVGIRVDKTRRSTRESETTMRKGHVRQGDSKR